MKRTLLLIALAAGLATDANARGGGHSAHMTGFTSRAVSIRPPSGMSFHIAKARAPHLVSSRKRK